MPDTNQATNAINLAGNYTTIIVVVAFLIITMLYTISDLLPFDFWLLKSIRRSRVKSTIDILKELGVDIPKMKEALLYAKMPSFFSGERIREAAVKITEKHSTDIEITVGQDEYYKSTKFVNILGASVNTQESELIAKILYSYMKENASAIGSFDFICAPKNGSPFIGYELSKIIKVPFIVHKGKNKITYESTKELNMEFDGYMPKPESTGILIDDSSTGGSMLINAANSLRLSGYTVQHAVVLFIPRGKNGESELKANNLTLHGPTIIGNDKV